MALFVACLERLLVPLLFFFVALVLRPHEAHGPLDAGRAFVFERAPLAASHAFVPMLNHQRYRRQVLQQSVAWDDGQRSQRATEVRPLGASTFPKDMGSNANFDIERMPDIKAPILELQCVDMALRHGSPCLFVIASLLPHPCGNARAVIGWACKTQCAVC